MTKLLSALRKETLVLIRDVPGLLILFIMPVLLILVVVVAQENALKASRETKTGVLFVDKSHTETSKAIEQSLANSGFYTLVKEDKGRSIDEKRASDLISEGDYQLGIILKENDSAIHILIDPTLQEAYKN